MLHRVVRVLGLGWDLEVREDVPRIGCAKGAAKGVIWTLQTAIWPNMEVLERRDHIGAY